jgi:MFS family permease
VTDDSRLAQLAFRSDSFSRLLAANTVSSLGNNLAAVALSLDVWDRTHRSSWVALVLAGNLGGAFVVGALLSPLLDRWPRKWLMVGSDLVSAAAFLLLLVVRAPLGIVGVAALVGLMSAVFRPSTRAVVPRLVADRDLAAANGLLTSCEASANALGALAGGAAVALSGPLLAYLVNAVSFLASATLVGSARIPRGVVSQRVAGHWRQLGEGFRFVYRQPTLRMLLVSWNLAAFGFAVANVAEVALIRHTLHGSALGFGVASASAALGAMVGSIGAARLLRRSSPNEVLAGALAVMALAALATALAPTVIAACPALFALGLANGVGLVCMFTLMQRAAPEELRGRVLSALFSTISLTMMVSTLLGGALCDWLGARTVWAAAAGLILGGAGSSRALREHGEIAPAPALAAEGP